MFNSIIEFIMNLFRSPAHAAQYVADPHAALTSAGLSAVTAAQVGAVLPVVAQSVASTYGYQSSHWVDTGNPFHDLSGNLQNYYAAQPGAPSILSPNVLSPHNNDLMSHNDTELASHNPVNSGNVDSFNRGPLVDLSFGDLQFGNRDSNAIGDGAVAVGGSNAGPIASGSQSTAVGGDVHGNVVNAGHGGSAVVDQSDTSIGGDYTNLSGRGTIVSDKSTHVEDSFNTDRSIDVASHNHTSTDRSIDIASHNQAHTGLGNSHTTAVDDALNSAYGPSLSPSVTGETHHGSIVASRSIMAEPPVDHSLGSTTGFEHAMAAHAHDVAADHSALAGIEHH